MSCLKRHGGRVVASSETLRAYGTKFEEFTERAGGSDLSFEVARIMAGRKRRDVVFVDHPGTGGSDKYSDMVNTVDKFDAVVVMPRFRPVRQLTAPTLNHPGKVAPLERVPGDCAAHADPEDFSSP